MFHQGKYRLKKPEKYRGDPSNVCFRSGWERSTFIWLEKCDQVQWWSSESTVVPYRSPVDGELHRYFVDLTIRWRNGTTWLAEIKPSSQCEPPKQPSRKTKKFLQEAVTYATNQAKWDAAKRYADERDSKFVVLTEEDLKRMGVVIV